MLSLLFWSRLREWSNVEYGTFTSQGDAPASLTSRCGINAPFGNVAWRALGLFTLVCSAIHSHQRPSVSPHLVAPGGPALWWLLTCCGRYSIALLLIDAVSCLVINLGRYNISLIIILFSFKRKLREQFSVFDPNTNSERKQQHLLPHYQINFLWSALFHWYPRVDAFQLIYIHIISVSQRVVSVPIDFCESSF